MCTVVNFVKDTLFFGRNMDIEYDFGQKIVVMPGDYPLHTKLAGSLLVHYATIGAARAEEGFPLYAEAANEKGLCMAGLNFPFNAQYFEKAEEGKTALAPYEMIPYFLARCATVGEAKLLAERVEIVRIPFNEALPLAPLHWIVADKTGSIVIEQTAQGLKIHDNPVGVLTNNPPFEFHLQNIKKSESLCAKNPDKVMDEDKKFFSQGKGAVGLPGDFSSESRFVKAWFCLKNSECGDSDAAKTAQTFRILDGVAMIRGSVITDEDRRDITRYSCCIDAENGAYYYKKYDDLNVKCVHMTKENTSGEKLAVYEM